MLVRMTATGPSPSSRQVPSLHCALTFLAAPKAFPIHASRFESSKSTKMRISSEQTRNLLRSFYLRRSPSPSMTPVLMLTRSSLEEERPIQESLRAWGSLLGRCRSHHLRSVLGFLVLYLLLSRTFVIHVLPHSIPGAAPPSTSLVGLLRCLSHALHHTPQIIFALRHGRPRMHTDDDDRNV